MRGELKLDDQFTQAALQTAFRQRFSLIHIASHFSFEPGNDTNSFLMLGDGAHLTLARLKTFPPSNSFDLLTLSACNTGLNEGNTEGKEVDGLGVLAQRKGAQAVLASLWEVSDESTSLLMQRFYTLREAHPEATKGGALRDAQLEMLRGGIKPSDRATTRHPLSSALRSNSPERIGRRPPLIPDIVPRRKTLAACAVGVACRSPGAASGTIAAWKSGLTRSWTRGNAENSRYVSTAGWSSMRVYEHIAETYSGTSGFLPAMPK